MKQTFRSLALAAIAVALGFSGSAFAGHHCCPPGPDLSSYSQVAGSTSAGPNQVGFAASHAENQGFAVVTPDAAIAGNHSEGSAVQLGGGTATFEAGGYAGGEMARYGCFDTVVGASTYSQVGGAAFDQYSGVNAEAGAIATAGLDYGRFDVQTYADGFGYSGVNGNGAAMSGYDAYANVDND